MKNTPWCCEGCGYSFGGFKILDDSLVQVFTGKNERLVIAFDQIEVQCPNCNKYLYLDSPLLEVAIQQANVTTAKTGKEADDLKDYVRVVSRALPAKREQDEFAIPSNAKSAFLESLSVKEREVYKTIFLEEDRLGGPSQEVFVPLIKKQCGLSEEEALRYYSRVLHATKRFQVMLRFSGKTPREVSMMYNNNEECKRVLDQKHIQLDEDDMKRVMQAKKVSRAQAREFLQRIDMMVEKNVNPNSTFQDSFERALYLHRSIEHNELKRLVIYFKE